MKARLQFIGMLLPLLAMMQSSLSETLQLQQIHSSVNYEQAASEEDDSDEMFHYSCTAAHFPGGRDSLNAYLKKAVVYPETAQRNGVKGVVKVDFCIREDGNIVDVKIVQSVDSLLDNEVVRVVENMPNWIPATERHKPVKSKYRLPVNFDVK